MKSSHWLVEDSFYAWYVLVSCKHKEQGNLSEMCAGWLVFFSLNPKSNRVIFGMIFKTQLNLVKMNILGS